MITETFEEKRGRERIEAAEALMATAQRERDAALAELEKVKRDVGWMMKNTLIRDVIFQSNQIPAGEPPYQMRNDTEDTDRLRWVNENARVSMGNGVFCVAMPLASGDINDATLPTPYNIRHLIDLCRLECRSAPATA